MSNLPFKGAWLNKNKNYRFISSDVQTLEPGYYAPRFEYPNWWLERSDTYFDRRVQIKDQLTDKALESINKFWAASEAYKKIGAVHKRGIYLYGPPGTGKSVAVNALADKVVSNGGVILLAGQHDISNVEDLMIQVRTSNRDQPIAVIMEDIETFIREEKPQKAVLNMLSGQRQIDNVLFIATSNLMLADMMKLCPPLVNRPSRFDQYLYVGYPTINHKVKFLSGFTKDLTADNIRYIAENTADCSIAHLKEIVIAVTCLDEDLIKTVDRVRTMKIDAPKASEEDDSDFEDEDEIEAAIN